MYLSHDTVLQQQPLGNLINDHNTHAIAIVEVHSLHYALHGCVKWKHLPNSSPVVRHSRVRRAVACDEFKTRMLNHTLFRPVVSCACHQLYLYKSQQSEFLIL